MKASKLVAVGCCVSAVAAFGVALPDCLKIVDGSCCTALQYDPSIDPFYPTACVSCELTGCCGIIVTDPVSKVPVPIGANETGNKGAEQTGAVMSLCYWRAAACDEAGFCYNATTPSYSGCRHWQVTGAACQ